MNSVQRCTERFSTVQEASPKKSGRILVGALVVSAAMVLTPMAGQSASVQPNNQNQLGLVNVAIGDITVLENVAVAVAAQAGANICDLAVGNVAVLATLVAQEQAAEQVCMVEQGNQTVPVTIQPGTGNGGGGGGRAGGQAGNNQNQAGLVNVALGDITILENLAVGVAAQIAANICNVALGNVAVLAGAVAQDQRANQACEVRQGNQMVPVMINPAG